MVNLQIDWCLQAPSAQALAVRNGKITAIGTNEDVLAWQTPETVVHDFNGAFIMPVSLCTQHACAKHAVDKTHD